jgi:Tol biopolymer transport system component
VIERATAAAALLAVVGASSATAQSVARVETPHDRVAYSTFAPGNWDLYVVETPGAPPRPLAHHPALDYGAVVSPDGRWLVFCSERRGDPDLFVLDLADEDSEPRLLIDSDALEDQPAFAPDGRSIAFVGTASGNADVYTLPFTPRRTVAMSAARNVTNDFGGDFAPTFSPDGRTLAFSSDRGLPVRARSSITRLRDGDIYSVELSSGTATRLTDAEGWDGSPAFSPDGRTIVFYAERGLALDHTQTKLFAMNADGSSQRALATPAAVGEISPRFLPDGRIVFAQRVKPLTASWDEPGTWQIVSVRADGTDLVAVTRDATANFWTPTAGPSAGSIVAHGTAPSSDGDERLLVRGAPFVRMLANRKIGLYPLRSNLGAVLHPTLPLVLHSNVPGVDLTLTDLDAGGQQRLVEFAAPRNRPFGFGWTRDGARTAFSRGGARAIFGGATDGDVWTMRADGTEHRNLTPDSTEDDGYPSFSSDGAWLVFRRGSRGRYDLYLMRSDGSDARRLTHGDASYLDPVFAPNANRIAYLSNGAASTSALYDVYLMELTEDLRVASTRRITANNVQEGHVAFSHDGEWLVFASEQGGIVYETPLFPQPQAYGEIYAYRIADGMTVRLTHNRWEEGAPSWEKALSR